MSRSSVAAMQRSNQNMCKTHVFETHSNRNNKSRLENRDIVCERRGRESNVALLWKSGVRVTKWAIPTYNGAGRAFARLSALPRWTPQPHPIQCDGFEPRRPHGGAFDSAAIQRVLTKTPSALWPSRRALNRPVAIILSRR